MANSILSAEQVADFHRDGYLIVRAMFDPEEMDILRGAAKADAAIKEHAYLVDDGKGAATVLREAPEGAGLGSEGHGRPRFCGEYRIPQSARR